MSAGTPIRLLLVEDDHDLALLLERILGDNGYGVTAVGDGRAGLEQLLHGDYDIAVVDRGLPFLNGLDLLARVRANHIDTPVLVLSARGAAGDRVEGIEAGAEDYLTKPFDIGELVARLHALLRRRNGSRRWLTIGNLQVDTLERVAIEATTGEFVASLSERETSLLRVLAARPGRLFDRAELRELVFTDADSDAAVDSYVHYCRRKLGEAVIITVRGYGYRIGSP